MDISKEQIETMLLVAGEKKACEAMERVWEGMSSAERRAVLRDADLHPEWFVATELAFFQGKIEAMETPAQVQETRERTWAGMTMDERKELLDIVASNPMVFTDGERAFFATKSVDEPTVPYTFQEELDVLSKAGPVALLLSLLGAYAKRPVFGVDVHTAGPAHPEQVRALLSDEAWDLAMRKAQDAVRKNINV